MVEAGRIEELPGLAEGVEATVYYDEGQEAVYKITWVDEGFAGGAHMAGAVVDYNGLIIPEDPQRITLVQHLFRYAHQNRHGGFVWTELVGLTESGDLVTKQPYVAGLRPYFAMAAAMRGELKDAELEVVREAMMGLGLAPLATPSVLLGSFAAVGRAGRTPIMVDDLHGLNIMRDEAGRPFIVDAVTRTLRAGEAQLPSVAEALAQIPVAEV